MPTLQYRPKPEPWRVCRGRLYHVANLAQARRALALLRRMKGALRHFEFRVKPARRRA